MQNVKKRLEKRKGLINMAMKKSNIDLKRVNMNLPSDLVDRVVAYGDKLGINTTNAYIVLLNQALDQQTTLHSLPQIYEVMMQLKTLETIKDKLDN